MPPKSDYWKHFVVQGVLAICQIQGCPKPNVSLGSVPKPGQKKRISEYIFYTTAALYHNAFFQQPVQSQTTWSSITRQSGTPTLKPEQGRLRWRPWSSRRWRSPARWTTLKCASTMWGQARVVFLFWTRWAAVRLIFHLFVILLFRSCLMSQVRISFLNSVFLCLKVRGKTVQFTSWWGKILWTVIMALWSHNSYMMGMNNDC